MAKKRARTGQYVVLKFEKAIEGDSKIVEKGVKLIQFPNYTILNYMQSSQGSARKLGNPEFKRIECVTEVGSHLPPIFQTVVDGTNVSKVVITSFTSTKETKTKDKELELQNCFVTNMEISGGRDGVICSFTIVFDAWNLTQSVIDNTHTPKGNAAAGGSFDEQTAVGA